MSIALYVIAALEAISGLYSVSRVGQPRKPLTGADAATLVVIDAALVVILVLAALRLS